MISKSVRTTDSMGLSDNDVTVRTTCSASFIKHCCRLVVTLSRTFILYVNNDSLVNGINVIVSIVQVRLRRPFSDFKTPEELKIQN